MKSKKSVFFIKAISSLIVGFINGFFGGGGGLIAVPVLEKIYKLNTKQAHATAIAVILPISIISSVVYIVNVGLKFSITASVAFGVLLGGFLGAMFLKKLNFVVIRWIFILVLFIAGIRMVA